ncbi:MAG: hypothetical protein ABSE62_13520 [Chthoniobacteraceae bacterium]|jgi:hypothetical protein
MSGQPEARGLVFPGGEARIYPLLGFIALSACVHAFGFYVFQTIYPAAAHIGPPPVQVSLLMPGTPEADAILRWVNSEDPALAAEPAKAPIPDLMSLPYIPSYRTVHARPAMAPTNEPALPYPAGVSGLDLVQMAAAHPTTAPPPPAPTATALIFSGPLKDAALDLLPSLAGLREADVGELRPARYLLGVSGEGEVRYVFLQDTSGDKTLDESASRVLEQTRFRESDTGMTWGFATFYWGSAVYAPPEEGAQ